MSDSTKLISKLHHGRVGTLPTGNKNNMTVIWHQAEN